MRRPIQMQPLGNIQGRFKPQRVGSSTCAKPQVNIDGTVLGTTGEDGVDIDFSDYSHSLDGQEMFILQHALENGSDGGGLCHYTPYD